MTSWSGEQHGDPYSGLGAERFSYERGDSRAWGEAIGRHLATSQVDVLTPIPDLARLRALELGHVRLLQLDAGALELRVRPREDPRSADVVLPLAGAVSLSQGQRASAVTAGGLAVLETGSPYELQLDRRASFVLLRAPHSSLAVPSAMLHLGASPLGPVSEGDLVGVLATTLARLAEGVVAAGCRSPARVANHFTDLVTTILLEHLSLPSSGGPAQRLFLEVTSFIDEHLGDAELSTDSLAAAHYISPRYLRKLFESQHVTVSEWVRARRLDACRRDLADPSRIAEPISAIASRWGFHDPAHFSRVFRAAFGRSPRQERQRALTARRHDCPRGERADG